MKHLSFIVTALFALLFIQPATMSAQDADEIIGNYLENTGGIDAWRALKGVKTMAKLNQQGMEIPLEIVQLSDGKQYSMINFQGNIIMQGVFDGETMWNTNFQTMKAEKADAEMTEMMKLNANDFPDSFLDYKDKGYTVELEGMETMEGTETYKIKLVKEPITVEGEKVDDVSYYYFDTENYVPIVMESEVKMGPQKGIIQQITFSDYQEVEGLYFAFSITQGIKDGPSQPIMFESIELNPEIDESLFAFPVEENEEENK
jgi:outer membrane lipoprotein-sorting protein